MAKKIQQPVVNPRSEVEKTLVQAKANVTELSASLGGLLQQIENVKKQIDAESAVVQALQFALGKWPTD